MPNRAKMFTKVGVPGSTPLPLPSSTKGSTVISKYFSLRLVAVAALIASSGAANATDPVTLISYDSTQAGAFAIAAATLPNQGSTDFSTLTAGHALTELVLTAGPFGYKASAPNGTYVIDSGAGNWLSTFAPETLTLTFAAGSGVRAVGGNFFTNNFSGSFLGSETVTVTATDQFASTSQLSFTATSATDVSGFAGFKSIGEIRSLTVSAVQDTGQPQGVFPTISSLTVAGVVPEPETYALLLAGLGVVGFMARRRRA